MEQGTLLDSLKKKLDEISERQEILIQHPRQGKSHLQLVKFLEQIAAIGEEEEKKLVVVMSGNISRDITVLNEAVRAFSNIKIVCLNNSMGSLGSISRDSHLEYGLDFGTLDTTVLSKVTAKRIESFLPTEKVIMSLKNETINLPLIQKDFDYLRGERKGKYSKYHKNNRFHK